MAHDDQSGLPIEFVKTLWHLTHRDMDSSWKRRKFKFGRLANIEKHDLVSQCAQMGELMLERLTALQELPIVGEVRGKGLLIGMEFVADKDKGTPFDVSKGVTSMIVNLAFEKGVLVMPGAPGLVDGVAGDHIAISPPFTITESEVLHVVDVLKETIEEASKRLGY